MMLSKVNHLWRWLGTAFSFFVFGLGGLFLTVLIVPALYLLPGTAHIRERRAQKLIHILFRAYINLMKCLGVLTYESRDVDKLKGAKLILANHPSLIDVIFLIAMVPNANCVVKGALVRNPCIRGAIKVTGYIVNNGGAEEVIDAADSAFKKGHALIIFPEGTRTVPDQPLHLKRGAANVAVRARADITPVVIQCNPTTLTKSDRWYQVPESKVRFQIIVKDQIDVSSYLKDMSPSKAARVLTRDLSEYFNKELGFNE